MINNFTTGFNKPSIFTAQTYGTKTTVEVDHSDLNLDEVMNAFQTLIIGMGYHQNSFKSWVVEKAEEYRETDAEDLKEKLEAWKFEEDDTVLRHGYENRDEMVDKPQYDWNEVETNERMDIIGQNGNDGLHYRATEKDDLFEGTGWEINESLKAANERYKSEVKKMNTKQKRNSKK